jgi:hypothetical protein
MPGGLVTFCIYIPIIKRLLRYSEFNALMS